MKTGTYRNRAGAELRIVGPWMGTHRVKTLGGIYEAEAPDPLFGPTTYIVTEQAMSDAGYELVEPEGGPR